MYTYNWYQWLAFFYIYCFLGWIFESTYVSLRKHCLINRGFLRIPLLPLYGTGAVMLLWVTLPVRDNLFLVYLFGMLSATALEYITGYMMERLFKMRYWDYSDQQFHLHGYICLSSSIAWGFLTLFVTEVIHQPIADFVLGINPVLLIGCVAAITAVFSADAYESTKEALELGATLEILDSIKREMDELEAKLAAVREEAASYAVMVREEAAERLASVKAETDVRVEAALLRQEKRLEHVRTEALELRLHVLNEKKQSAFRAKNRLGHFYRRQLLKGNPTASSRFVEALQELKDKLK